MPPRHNFRSLGFLTAAGSLLILSPGAQAGLAFSRVKTLTQDSTAPDTTMWDDFVNLFVGNVQSDFAALSGDMTNLSLHTFAQIADISNDRAANTQSEVSFVDAITLNAPGIPTGTDLLVQIAWKVTGSDSVTSTNASIQVGSSLLLDGPGSQKWQRFRQEPGPDSVDPFGQVVFEYPIKAGTPEPGNVNMTATAACTAGFVLPIFPVTYNAEADADIDIEFCGIVDVKTTGGTDIGLWTVAAESLLDYGEGTQAPTLSSPALTIGPSPNGPDFVRLSWQGSLFETYTIEGSDGVAAWSNDATAPGEDGVINIDLMPASEPRIYRLANVLTP